MFSGQPAYLRELASRYRRLASAMADPATVDALKSKAREIEEQARLVEYDVPRKRDS
jgi:hypothetical protein